MLKIRNLTFSYGEVQTLRGIDMDIPEGRVTCIMGRNGVGKTTLVKNIMGLENSRSGSIHMGTLELTKMPFQVFPIELRMKRRRPKPYSTQCRHHNQRSSANTWPVMSPRRFAFMVWLLALLTFPPVASAGTFIPVPPARVANLLNGRLVEASEFRIAPIHLPFCPLIHYHAAQGQSVTALDLTEIFDPEPGTCGFGPLGSLPVGIVYDLAIPDVDFDGVPDALEASLGLDPNSPDSDGDGLLDADEDFDMDLLTNAEEIILHATDPTNPHTGGSANLDGIDVILSRTSKDFVVIPVLVNIHPVSTVTEQYARDAVKKANIPLKEGRIRLEVVSVNQATADEVGDDGTGGGTAGDGSFNFDGAMTEFGRALGEGRKEVSMRPNQKGLKLIFGRDQSAGSILDGSDTPGASLHKFETILVQKRATIDLTGATIAHELGHALTIKKHPADDDDATDEEMTSANWMTPSRGIVPGMGPERDAFVNSPDPDKGVENVEISPRQRALIHSGMVIQGGIEHNVLDRIGLKGTMNSPAVKTSYQLGIAVDDQNDQTGGVPSYFDLATASVVSDADVDTLDVLLSVHSLLDDFEQVDATFSILFDADANAATGQFVQGVPGIEREVKVVVQRLSGTADVSADAYLFDWVTFTSFELAPSALVSTLDRLSGFDEPGDPFSTAFTLRLMKDLLNLTAPDVPVTVVSADDNVRDILSLIFDRDVWQDDPTLTLFEEEALGGQSLSFDLSGLAPNEAFTLSMDDILLLSDMTDMNGALSGNFVIPHGLSPDFYFLTAQADGRLAISALNVIPEPGVHHLLLIGFTLLCVARRARPAPSGFMAGIADPS